MTTPVHLDAAARALDALPAAEARAFDLHLAECDTCAIEYAEFLATTALLGAAAAMPAPQQLREKVMAAASRTPQLPPVPAETGGRRRGPRRPRTRRLLLAAAVVAALIAGGVTVAIRLGAASPQQAAAQCVAAAADAQVEHPSVGSGGSVTLARSCDAAVVQIAAMPTLPSGRAYQLWVIAGKSARSAGMVARQVNPAGRIVVTGITPGDTAVGISVEPSGGSKSPTTSPIWVVPLRG